MTDAAAVLLLVSTGGRDEAERLGEGLVEAELAACASVIPMVHSIYRWEGRMRREHESLLLVKTTTAAAAAAQEYLREHHSYEVPEILRVDITGGLPAYLNWLAENVKG